MPLALHCPSCRHPLASLDVRGVDYFCEECFASVAVIDRDACYYQLGRASGAVYRCSLESLERAV